MMNGLRNLAATRHGGVGLVILVVLVLTALFAPIVAPHGAMTQVGTSLMPPSFQHPMGTDNIGRDLLSLIIYGSRASLAIGFAAALAALLIGGTIGAVAGYFRGATE